MRGVGFFSCDPVLDLPDIKKKDKCNNFITNYTAIYNFFMKKLPPSIPLSLKREGEAEGGELTKTTSPPVPLSAAERG
jgi:hypothetical protein